MNLTVISWEDLNCFVCLKMQRTVNRVRFRLYIYNLNLSSDYTGNSFYILLVRKIAKNDY